MSAELAPGGWCRLHQRALVRIAGEEARGFLQGLISNDIELLDHAPAIYAALLTPQGKYLFDFLVIATADGVLLEVEAARRATLLQRLMLYRLRAKVELTAIDNLAVFVRAGTDGVTDNSPDGAFCFADPRHGDLGWRVVGPAEPTTAWLAANGPELPLVAYERHRLRLGVPEGSGDLEPDKALLLESGFVELHGVSFDKGCFVGQELTARMRYRATVRKRLLPMQLDGAATPGAAILDGDIEVGELRTCEGDIGLGLVRLDRWQKAVDAGRKLQAEAAVVAPWVPPWVDLSFASKTAESSA